MFKSEEVYSQVAQWYVNTVGKRDAHGAVMTHIKMALKQNWREPPGLELSREVMCHSASSGHMLILLTPFLCSSNLYNNTPIAFKERCFGYILRQSGSRQSAISHTSGKN